MRDQHCHILWGVDDGAATWDDTLAMLAAAKEAGVDRMVCTPHLRWDDFDEGVVRSRFAQFKEHSADAGVTAELGFEVYYKTLLKRGLDCAPRYCLDGTNQLLLEFNSGGEIPFGWEQTVDKLRNVYGLDVTIAHPERYSTAWKDFDAVYQLKDAGCSLQVSAMDLEGGFLSKPTKVAKRMMKEGLCDALVSDAHRAEHYARFAKMTSRFGTP
ncbi:MAG: protein tyrosine phosphatase [Coriobacteriia bacterium]|nr:protein tyrosine phosphatase [Coriobacteriia bacterium]